MTDSSSSKERDIAERLRAIALGVRHTNAIRADQIDGIAFEVQQYMEWAAPQLTHYAEQRDEIERLQRELESTQHELFRSQQEAASLANARAAPEPNAGYTHSHVMQFIGWLTGDIPELRKTHPGNLQDSWERFCKRMELNSPAQPPGALQEELDVMNRLLDARNELLDAIPECPAHGPQCVPHALEWVRERASQPPGAGLIEQLTNARLAWQRDCRCSCSGCAALDIKLINALSKHGQPPGACACVGVCNGAAGFALPDGQHCRQSYEDAERFQYLCADILDRERRDRRNALLDRMATMSISAVRDQIDRDVAVPTKEEGR